MGILDNLLGGKRLPILEGMDSIIGANARFKGELATSGSVNVGGEFEGKIKAEGEVIVSQGGVVVGEVQGGSVVVSGRVDGNITAKGDLEIARSGRVHGDIVGGKIIIEEGSSYHGRVKVESGPVEEEVSAGGARSSSTASYSTSTYEGDPQESQPQIFPGV